MSIDRDTEYVLTLDVPDESLRALGELAEVTGRMKPKRRGLMDRLLRKPPTLEPDHVVLIQDALRTYEWVLQKQVEGETIISIPATDLETLRSTSELEGHKSEGLVSFIQPGKEILARKYFTNFS